MINLRLTRFLELTFKGQAWFNKINPYLVLGVNFKSKPDEIKLAYYKLAQSFHPDKNTSPNAAKQFAQINEAYEILSD